MTIFLTLAIFILALFVVRLTRRVSALEDQLLNTGLEAQADAERPDETENNEIGLVAEAIAQSSVTETSPAPQRTPWGKKRETTDPGEAVLAPNEDTPTAYVFKQSMFSGLWAWVAQNWFFGSRGAVVGARWGVPCAIWRRKWAADTFLAGRGCCGFGHRTAVRGRSSKA